MSLILSGSDGLSDVDGTAATPAIRGTDTNTGIFFPAADTIAFAEGGVEAMRIDSSGNVGIGTSSPDALLSLNKASGASDIRLKVGSVLYGNLYSSASDTNLFSVAALPLILGTNNTERMRIDSSGNLLVGITSNAYPTTGRTVINVNGTSQALIGMQIGGTAKAYILHDGTDMNIQNQANGFLSFATNNAERMRIDSSGGLILAGSTAQKATGTTWSNPSDARLKDNIRDYTKGIDELMQVRVREWEYNGKGGTTEGTKGLGVVADEVMVVLPNTVENYEAKLNADDEEVSDIKKFDATEITWLLVKTVQEQQAIITDLKSRIEALEVK